MPEDEARNSTDYEIVWRDWSHQQYQVRPEGTGEMIYSGAGTRRHAAVRSESGKAIARDVEVVVTRYERGIAYVHDGWKIFAGNTGADRGRSMTTQTILIVDFAEPGGENWR